MLGAIAGDMFGAPYEGRPAGTAELDLLSGPRFFTDDSVMTIATADAILGDGDFAGAYRRWGRSYPDRGYGGMFFQWIHRDGAGPYGSFGNGSAMRVSPVGWAHDTADEVLDAARRSAEVTHDHPEGIKGAQATALAVFRARIGVSKEEIRYELTERFGYDLARTVEGIRPQYGFDVTCQGSVPEAIVAFLDAHSVDHAIRLAISLGGDADTQAAIAGSIAEAYSDGVPPEMEHAVREALDSPLLAVVDRFQRRYGP